MSRFRAFHKLVPVFGAYTLVLAVLSGTALYITSEGDGAERTPLELVAPPTRTRGMPSPPATSSALIHADGIAQPARMIQLASPIRGQVHSVHQALQPGGVIPAGESLWWLDKSESEARLRAAQSRLANIIARAELERGRARAAQREWEALGMSESATDHRDRAIALREPQAAEVEAQIDTALAGVNLAEIDLARCTASLDVKLAVLEESIEPGLWVEPGQQLVTGMEAGRWHIIALLTPAQVDWLRGVSVESVSCEVRVLGSLGKPLEAEVVSWLPHDTGRPQMRGILLDVRTDTSGVLWSGAQVDVTLRSHNHVGRDACTPSVEHSEVLTDAG